MAVNDNAAAPEPSAEKRLHGAQQMPRLARDVIQADESVLFDMHEDAIDAMEALHELELPADAPPEQRAAKRRAFMAMSAVARLSAPMEVANTTYLEMKTDGRATRAALDKVRTAQAERSERKKAGR